LNQLEAQALPENHPSAPELSKLFGEHAFFLDERGLNIVVPIKGGDEDQAGAVVGIAAWQDANRPTLRSHEPEPTGVVVDLRHARAWESASTKGLPWQIG
jgi:hypothetical protein